MDKPSPAPIVVPLSTADPSWEPIEEGVAANSLVVPVSDESPRWPDDVAESSFLSQQPALSSVLPSVEQPVEDKDDSTIQTPLPELQSLVDRIPEDTRATLEDLFRAHFVSVRQIQKTSLNLAEA